MKRDIHPAYHPVIFVDITNGARFFGRSTKTTDRTEEVDGVTHYIIPLSVSSETHPFYTGKSTFVDTEGRIDKFTKRFGEGIRRGGKPRLGV